MARFLLVYRSGRMKRRVRASALSALDAMELIERTRQARIVRVDVLGSSRVRDRRTRLDARAVNTCFDGLEFLVAAGTRVDVALRSLVDRLPLGRSRHVWVEVLAGLEATGSFSRALGRFPLIFDGTVVGIAAAAEASGQMLDGIRQIAAYLKQMAEIRSQVQRGLVYPGILLALCLVTLVLLCEFTLPRYQAMLTGMGVVRYNPVTAAFFWASTAFQRRPYLVALLVPFGAGLFQLGRLAAIRRRVGVLALRIPVLASAVEAVVMARICLTFVSLTQAGFRTVEALGTCALAAGNAVYRDALLGVVASVEANASLGDAFERAAGFSPAFVIAVRSGEGDLPQVFGRLGDYYAKEARLRIETAIKLVEPALLLLVIGVVFGTALAVILPMVDIIESLHS